MVAVVREYIRRNKGRVAVAAVGLAALLTVGMVLRARSGDVKYLTAKPT
jgi:hypothetical protein